MPDRILRNWTDSAKFENLSAESERLFTRLIMSADDFGRFHGDSRLIKAACFPLVENLRTNEVDRWLDELSTRQLILRYEVAERKYLAIVNFGQRLRTVRAKFPQPAACGGDWLANDGDIPRLVAGCGELPQVDSNSPQSAADCGELPQSAASKEEKRREVEEKGGGREEAPPPIDSPETLIPKINNLKPSWLTAPHLTQPELYDLHKNRTGLEAISESDWETLTAWAASTEGHADWLMKTRSRFLSNYTEALMKSSDWLAQGGSATHSHMSLGGRKPHSHTTV